MTTPDFSKIWASESPLTPYTFDNDDYLEGWATIGEIPPDRRQFDTWQRLADTKMLWLKNNMLGYLLRQNSTAYEVGDIAFSASLPSSLVLLCTTAGTTAATKPDFSEAEEDDTVTDGTVVWTYKNLLSGDGGGVPVGFIAPYAGTGLAEGWLDCDGSAVSRTMYPDLFAAIGTTFGPGDGSTTFNLPSEQFAKAWVGSYASGSIATVFGDGSALQLEKTGSTSAVTGNRYSAIDRPYGVDYAQSANNTGMNVVSSGATGIFADLSSAPDATITPQYSPHIRYMIKAFDGQTPDSALIDITQYAADLANKATRSLDNLNATGEARFAHVVVDSYYDSTTGDWWREYADGWIEQGGVEQLTTSGFHTINLLKPMSSADYACVTTREEKGTLNTGYTNGINNKTSTTFTVYRYVATDYCNWFVAGQGASA